MSAENGERHPDGNFHKPVMLARYDKQGNMLERKSAVRRTLLAVIDPDASVSCPRCGGVGTLDCCREDGELVVGLEDCDVCDGTGSTTSLRAEAWRGDGLEVWDTSTDPQVDGGTP